MAAKKKPTAPTAAPAPAAAPKQKLPAMPREGKGVSIRMSRDEYAELTKRAIQQRRTIAQQARWEFEQSQRRANAEAPPREGPPAPEPEPEQ